MLIRINQTSQLRNEEINGFGFKKYFLLPVKLFVRY